MRQSLIAAAALSLSACSHFFIAPDSYKQVKKVALVQYAINPYLLVGTVNAAEVKTKAATADFASFGKILGAKGLTVMPLEEMTAKAGYVSAGDATLAGYFTAPGLRYLTGRAGVETATLTPAAAQKLCADLGVDAVALAYGSWDLDFYALGFKAHAMPTITVNLFDKTGARVWGDQASGTSGDGVASPGGIIADSVDNTTAIFSQGFTAAITQMTARL